MCKDAQRRYHQENAHPNHGEVPAHTHREARSETMTGAGGRGTCPYRLPVDGRRCGVKVTVELELRLWIRAQGSGSVRVTQTFTAVLLAIAKKWKWAPGWLRP